MYSPDVEISRLVTSNEPNLGFYSAAAILLNEYTEESPSSKPDPAELIAVRRELSWVAYDEAIQLGERSALAIEAGELDLAVALTEAALYDQEIASINLRDS